MDFSRCFKGSRALRQRVQQVDEGRCRLGDEHAPLISLSTSLSAPTSSGKVAGYSTGLVASSLVALVSSSVAAPMRVFDLTSPLADSVLSLCVGASVLSTASAAAYELLDASSVLALLVVSLLLSLRCLPLSIRLL